jgi:hypothetical protein
MWKKIPVQPRFDGGGYLGGNQVSGLRRGWNRKSQRNHPRPDVGKSAGTGSQGPSSITKAATRRPGPVPPRWTTQAPHPPDHGIPRQRPGGSTSACHSRHWHGRASAPVGTGTQTAAPRPRTGDGSKDRPASTATPQPAPVSIDATAATHAATRPRTAHCAARGPGTRSTHSRLGTARNTSPSPTASTARIRS